MACAILHNFHIPIQIHKFHDSNRHGIGYVKTGAEYNRRFSAVCPVPFHLLRRLLSYGIISWERLNIFATFPQKGSDRRDALLIAANERFASRSLLRFKNVQAILW